MKKVLCFGEILLRFAPDAPGQWLNENSLPVFVGGAELNVATALSLWQTPAAYMSAMPANGLTAELKDYINKKNIDASRMIESGSRIGTYYLTQGADLKHAAVIYDRAYSSFSELKTGGINWKDIFQDCSWFHFSAISPALNQEVADVCLEAVKVAKELGVKVSVDLNYRSLLWKYGKEPNEVMPELVQYCNVVMGNIWAANKLLGIALHDELIAKNEKNSYLDHASKTAIEIFEKFPSANYIANTFRFDAGAGINYYASLNTKEGQQVSSFYQCESVVDKVGSGDCFMGGLIYGIYHGHENGGVIDFAAAAAFNKLQQKGDATTSTAAEVEKIRQQHGAK